MFNVNWIVLSYWKYKPVVLEATLKFVHLDCYFILYIECYRKFVLQFVLNILCIPIVFILFEFSLVHYGCQTCFIKVCNPRRHSLSFSFLHPIGDPTLLHIFIFWHMHKFNKWTFLGKGHPSRFYQNNFHKSYSVGFQFKQIAWKLIYPKKIFYEKLFLSSY